MPYSLRKVPKKDLYWVVNKETGKKHSKEGLPKETAEAQMRALYAAESGYKLTGGAISMNFMQQMVQSSYPGKTKLQIGPFKLLTSTPTLKFYKDDNTIVIAVRGTQLTDKVDLAADAYAVVGKLRDSQRWKRDEAKIKEVQEKFPRKDYNYIAVGHSLGGAIIDLMLRDKLVRNALSYNPLVEPQELTGNPLHRRIYHKDDPLYQAFGRFVPNAEVRTTAEPFWKYYLRHNLPFGLGELFTLYDRHRIARFKGGKKLKGGVTINDVRRWLASPATERGQRRLELTGVYNAEDISNADIILQSLLVGLGTTALFQGALTNNPYLATLGPMATMIGQMGSYLGLREIPMPPTLEQEERMRGQNAPQPRNVFLDNIRRATSSMQSVGDFLNPIRRQQARRNQQAQLDAVIVNPMRNARRSNVASFMPQLPPGTVELIAQEIGEQAETQELERARLEALQQAAAGVGFNAPQITAENFENETESEEEKEETETFNPFNLASLRAQIQEEEQKEENDEENQLTAAGISELVFEDQLKELDYEPKKYLAKAKAKAKKNGYDPKKLTFCKNGTHKLQMETPDGKIVHFGRIGYGDFLIWSFLERNGKVGKGEARKRRKLYLKRASKIKGDWKEDKYSANNLAMKILW